MINSVSLTGRLTRDVEVKTSRSGVSYAMFSIAVDRTFKDNNGEKKADYINCIVYRQQAENLAKYQGKGSLIGVTGRLSSRSYDNQEGKKVYVTEVVCENISYLQSKRDVQGQSDDTTINTSSYQNIASQSEYGTNNNPFANNPNQAVVNDDDLPF